LQRRTAPQAERQRNGLRRVAGIALAQRNTRLCKQLLEARRVDRRIRQRVSVIGSDDRVLPERAAQTGDVVLKSVARCGRQLLSPQGVDQLVHSHDATAAEREQRKQTVPLAAAHLRQTPSGDDLERPEKPDLE
jgi:hypothetical protein